MSILLIYVRENNNNLINNFYDNCLDNDKINDKIIIDLEDNMNLNNYFQQIKNHQYVIYIDNKYNFNKNFYIHDYLNILNNNNVEQIFFCENTSKYKNIKNNLVFTDYKKYDFKTKKHLESSLTILENSNTLNYKGKNRTKIDYDEYIDNDNINWPHFKLLPSIIKSEVFEKLNNFNLSLNYYDRNFANEYIKYFKSCSLTNSICFKKYNKENRGNPDNMTIVTGFINIPHEGKKIKTHCFKKKTYSYEEKSIPTLKIKQKMVIYIPENLYNHVYKIRESIGYLDKTKIIVIKDEFLYMKDYLSKIKENCKKNMTTYRNHYYISAVSTRYNLLRDSIKNNYFNTEYTTWVDFGAVHCTDIKDDTVFSYNRDKFRIAWIARYNKNNNTFKYNHYVLGGTIFGGKNNILKLVCDLHDKIFKDNMELGYNCNDDKSLWFIFERYPELFDTYFAGYINIAPRYNR